MYFIKNRTLRGTEGSSVPGNGKKSVFCGYFTKNALFLQCCDVLNDNFLTKYREKLRKNHVRKVSDVEVYNYEKRRNLLHLRTKYGSIKKY